MSLRLAAIDVNGAIIASNNIREETAVDHYALVDGQNGKIIVAFDATGNLKGNIDIGGASDSVGFYGTTPVVQANAVTAVPAGTINSGDTTTDTIITGLKTSLTAVIAVLHNTGLTK